MIQLTLTLKMTTTQVVETLVNLNNNSPIDTFTRTIKLNLLLKWLLGSSLSQWKFWFQTDFGRENSASFYRQGRQLALPSVVTLYVPFSSPIGQNLTGEHMCNIYAASEILLTRLHDSRFMSQARRGETCVIELRWRSLKFKWNMAMKIDRKKITSYLKERTHLKHIKKA